MSKDKSARGHAEPRTGKSEARHQRKFALGVGPQRQWEKECPRESDVIDALASSRWPERVEAELADHVASCRVCQDVLTVASAMQADHDAAWKEANVPSSGQMWWRAEMRVKQDAVREASRPVAVAQGVAAVLALSAAGAAGWFAWPTVQGFFTTASFAQMPALASPMFIPLAVAMGALLVAAPVALYVVLSDKS